MLESGPGKARGGMDPQTADAASVTCFASFKALSFLSLQRMPSSNHRLSVLFQGPRLSHFL